MKTYQQANQIIGSLIQIKFPIWVASSLQERYQELYANFDHFPILLIFSHMKTTLLPAPLPLNIINRTTNGRSFQILEDKIKLSVELKMKE